MDVVVAHVKADVRAVVRTVLEREGARVHEATSAHEALDACRRHRPDVALVASDVALAGGASLPATIKGDPDLFRISVVLFCPDLDTEAAPAADLARGADDVLRDPPSERELVARVRAAGRTATLRDQLLERERGLEELAYSDELTKLYNRRFLSRQLSALVHSATRHERALSIVLVDIDRFKAINDVHGHDKGDAVLERVAARLARSLREEDVAGRWGGEEFLVVLPDIDETGAQAAAEKLRRAVAGRTIAGLRVTVSAGHATWVPGESADDLLRRADGALYEAKRAGRDRVHAA